LNWDLDNVDRKAQRAIKTVSHTRLVVIKTGRRAMVKRDWLTNGKGDSFQETREKMREEKRTDNEGNVGQAERMINGGRERMVYRRIRKTISSGES